MSQMCWRWEVEREKRTEMTVSMLLNPSPPYIRIPEAEPETRIQTHMI